MKSNGSVLVVEDNVDLRMLYRSALASEGYEVFLASNGKEALETLHEMDRKPSLILLDLMMPVMDGWEFLKKRATDARIADIPVVVCSASRDNIPPQTTFMKKPVELDSVLDVVEQYCRSA